MGNIHSNIASYLSPHAQTSVINYIITALKGDVLAQASVTESGFMSAADKVKLDAVQIFTGAGGVGLVPDPLTPGDTFLANDATWKALPHTEPVVVINSAGLAPPSPPLATEHYYLQGIGTWVNPTIAVNPAMGGSSATVAGTAGLVPAANSPDKNSQLTAAGVWVHPLASGPVFTNATSGLVPAPPILTSSDNIGLLYSQATFNAPEYVFLHVPDQTVVPLTTTELVLPTSHPNIVLAPGTSIVVTAGKITIHKTGTYLIEYDIPQHAQPAPIIFLLNGLDAATVYGIQTIQDTFSNDQMLEGQNGGSVVLSLTASDELVFRILNNGVQSATIANAWIRLAEID